MKSATNPATACPSPSEVDLWTVQAFAAGGLSEPLLATHLLNCPRCRRRAAIAWALLPEPACATMPTIPQPDLSFLKPVSADR